MIGNGFSPHPIADLFPMVSERELADLAADIRENGLLEPIVLHEAKILDGRNRYAACERAEVSPRFVEWKGEGGSPLRYVLSHNLHRRHLTTSQRAAIAAEVLPMFQEEARKRQVEAGKIHGRGQSEIAGGQKTTTFGKARDEAASMMNVSPATVERAKRVMLQAPDEFAMVKDGAKTVAAALRDAGLGDTNQNRRRKPRPSDDASIRSARDRIRAEAHKRRLETALSGIAGTCRGIEGIDLDLVRAVMSDEEVATWATVAGECARDIRNLRKNLNGNGQDE